MSYQIIVNKQIMTNLRDINFLLYNLTKIQLIDMYHQIYQTIGSNRIIQMIYMIQLKKSKELRNNLKLNIEINQNKIFLLIRYINIEKSQQRNLTFLKQNYAYFFLAGKLMKIMQIRII
ncbi:hypothetical protein pb186bvf_002646 [Paramecium bursaria]